MDLTLIWRKLSICIMQAPQKGTGYALILIEWNGRKINIGILSFDRHRLIYSAGVSFTCKWFYGCWNEEQSLLYWKIKKMRNNNRWRIDKKRRFLYENYTVQIDYISNSCFPCEVLGSLWKGKIKLTIVIDRCFLNRPVTDKRTSHFTSAEYNGRDGRENNGFPHQHL